MISTQMYIIIMDAFIHVGRCTCTVDVYLLESFLRCISFSLDIQVHVYNVHVQCMYNNRCLQFGVWKV